MWTFLLDPAVQGFAFLLAASVLGFVVWDLVEDTRNPAPSLNRERRRTTPSPAAPRVRAFVEPSVEIWTNAQGETLGRVRRGPAKGLRLEEMSREDCEAQTAYCRQHDPAAAVALESYIRHRFGQQRRAEAPPAPGGMTRAEALAELGLAEGATESQIHAAYRATIKRHHPDHGGSHAKAARINQAKDLLAE